MQTFIYSLLFLLLAVSQTAFGQIKVQNTWTGYVQDMAAKDALPASNIIAQQADANRIWKLWFDGQAAPKIAFDSSILAVLTVPAPNTIMFDSKRMLEVKEGDVKIRAASTRVGGPGFSFLLVQIPRANISSVNGKPVPKQAAAGRVTVDVSGVVKTGIVAIGAETTGTQISAGNMTFELKLTEDQMEVANGLSGQSAKVSGTLTKQAGVEVGDRWIVIVDSIKAAEETE